jgi:hypothetical protein
MERIRRAPVEDLPKQMAYIARSGIGTRGASNPHFFEADQLYDVKQDPREMDNVAGNPEYAPQLREMRRRLVDSLRSFDRPFGEFLPGGNAVGPGQVDNKIELVRQLEIQGKNVIVPDGLEIGRQEKQPVEKTPREERSERRESRRRSRNE